MRVLRNTWFSDHLTPIFGSMHEGFVNSQDTAIVLPEQRCFVIPYRSATEYLETYPVSLTGSKAKQLRDGLVRRINVRRRITTLAVASVACLGIVALGVIANWMNRLSLQQSIPTQPGMSIPVQEPDLSPLLSVTGALAIVGVVFFSLVFWLMRQEEAIRLQLLPRECWIQEFSLQHEVMVISDIPEGIRLDQCADLLTEDLCDTIISLAEHNNIFHLNQLLKALKRHFVAGADTTPEPILRGLIGR